ncbi:hypothetical protein RI367_005602 [Sorochytrium milnesiophthora]
MISSLFVCSDYGKVLLEQHYRIVYPEALVDSFLEHTAQHSEDGDRAVVRLDRYRCFVIQRCIAGLRWLAITESECSPLQILEFLDRFAALLHEYMGDFSEKTFKDQAGIIKELLEEVLICGFPLTTESNFLADVLSPTDLLAKLASVVTGHVPVSAINRLPKNATKASLIPWRKTGVRYARDEVYLDLNETLDLVLDRTGTVVGGAGIKGSAICNCRLSGTPDLTLSLNNTASLFDADAALQVHPCVRYNKLERDHVFSFVPPDGEFELFSYRLPMPAGKSLPITVRPRFSFTNTSLNLDITLSATLPRGPSPSGRSSPISRSPSSNEVALENVVLIIPLPRWSTQSVNLSTSVGTWVCDQTRKVVTWTIGRMTADSKQPAMNGSVGLEPPATMTTQTGKHRAVVTTLQVQFSNKGHNLSGLQVQQLTMRGESYTPYKSW